MQGINWDYSDVYVFFKKFSETIFWIVEGVKWKFWNTEIFYDRKLILDDTFQRSF